MDTPQDEKPKLDRTKLAIMTKEERINDFKSRTIAHPLLVKATEALLSAILEPGGASIILVYGPARVGKTTMLMKVMQRIIRDLLPFLENDKELIPLVYVLLQPPLRKPQIWSDYFIDGLKAIQEILVEHKISLERGEDNDTVTPSYTKRSHRDASARALRASFITAVKQRRPRAIFVDEAQHFAKVSSDQRLLDQLDCIKSMADLTKTVHVLAGPYELLEFRNLSAQLIGRSLNIHLPRYQLTDEGIKQFKGVLKSFQELLPFKEEPKTLLKHWKFCYQRSIGCVGNLHLMLVRAVKAALDANEETLSWKRLQESAFSIAEVHEMLEVARKGEEQLKDNDKHIRDLQIWFAEGLSNSSQANKTSPLTTNQNEPATSSDSTSVDNTTTDVGDTSSTTPPAAGESGETASSGRHRGRPKKSLEEVGQKPKANSGRKGKRNPHRDATGQRNPE